MLFRENLILNTSTIKQALLLLNNMPSRDSLTLFVINQKNKLIGSLTDGDIRRGLINNLMLEDNIESVMNVNFKFLKKGNYTLKDIDTFKKKEIDLVPFVDEDGCIIKIIDLTKINTVLPVDVVLMAGGEGKRLKPLTDDLPKPLLKIGDKPIIEHNIDRLISYGIDSVFISIKYLGSKIKDYFLDGRSKNITINYTEEINPVGTIGAVALISNFNHEDILVMNSDLLTNIDYEDFYRFFKNNNADMLVACIPYQVSLPYGIIENEGVKVIAIKEKPTYTYYSNAGIYLIKKEMFKYIPENELYNATDLIETLIKQNHTVINYPILTYWLDIGKHDDFIKAQEDIKHIKL